MRQGHEKDQPHVGHGGFGVDENLQAKGEDDCCPETGTGQSQAPSPGKNHERGERRRERAREPSRKRIFSKDPITRNLPPIGERRFIESIAIVKIGNDIIVRAQSFRARPRRNAAHHDRPAGAARCPRGEKADIRKRARENCQLQVARERFKDGKSRKTTGKFHMAKISPAWKWLLLVLLAVLAIVLAFHFDPAVNHWINAHSNRTAKMVMRNVSRFGDWPEHVLAGLVIVGIAAVRRKQALDFSWPNDDHRLRSRGAGGART